MVSEYSPTSIPLGQVSLPALSISIPSGISVSSVDATLQDCVVIALLSYSAKPDWLE
jgi:hypothetical protein